MIKLALSVTLTLGVAACRGDETVAAYGGADRIWVLMEINEAPFDAPATLSFPEPGHIAGNAPCNSYSAAMSAPYPWFETGPIAATKRACPDLGSETAFFDALARVTLSEVLDSTLVLSNPEGAEMVFIASD